MSFYGQVQHNLLLLEIWPQDKEWEDPWKCKDFVYKIASFLYVFKELELFLFCCCYMLALIKDPKIPNTVELSKELREVNEKVQ